MIFKQVGLIERLLTDFTSVRSLASVEATMSLLLRLKLKGFTTNVTFQTILICVALILHLGRDILADLEMSPVELLLWISN